MQQKNIYTPNIVSTLFLQVPSDISFGFLILLCIIIVFGVPFYFLMDANHPKIKLEEEPQVKLEEVPIKKEENNDEVDLAYSYNRSNSKCYIFDKSDPSFRHERTIFSSPIGTRPGELTEIFHNGVSHRCFSRGPTQLGLVDTCQVFNCKNFNGITVCSGGSPALIVPRTNRNSNITIFNANIT